jgi:hypothetical protein
LSSATSTPAAPVSSDELLTLPDCATSLGPSWTRRKVKHQIEMGRLTPVRIGQRTFVRRSELNRFVAQGD